MVDANYSLSLDQAIRAANRFKEFDITWFEEPMDPDDLDGYKQLSESVQTFFGDGGKIFIFFQNFAMRLIERILRISSLMPPTVAV